MPSAQIWAQLTVHLLKRSLISLEIRFWRSCLLSGADEKPCSRPRAELALAKPIDICFAWLACAAAQHALPSCSKRRRRTLQPQMRLYVRPRLASKYSDLWISPRLCGLLLFCRGLASSVRLRCPGRGMNGFEANMHIRARKHASSTVRTRGTTRKYFDHIMNLIICWLTVD